MIFLSVVIPVKNEEKFIENTLNQMISQEYPNDRYEILVIDGMSDDRTKDIVEKVSRINPDVNLRLLDNPRFLSSSARNIGAKAAKGEFVAVIDGHVFIPDNLLFHHIEKAVKENQAKVLSRPAPLDVPDLKDGKPFWIAISRKTWLGHSRSSFIYGEFRGFVDPTSSGFAYHKNIFEKVGFFDENFDAAEDVEFHHRIKKSDYSAYTAPELLIYSYPRASFSSLFKQQVRYGEGRYRLIRKHNDAFTPETLIPAAIFALFALFPLAMVLPLPLIFKILWLTAITGYLGIVFVTSLFETIKRKRFFPVIWVFSGVWLTHMGLGWGMIKSIKLKDFFLGNTKK